MLKPTNSIQHVNLALYKLQLVLILYHLKTRRCVKYCTHVSKLKHCCCFNLCIFAFIKSREKGLITKEHIVMHMHLNLLLNGLYTSAHQQ